MGHERWNSKKKLSSLDIDNNNTWKQVYGKDYIYGHDQGGRVKMDKGKLSQTLIPSSKGSTRDQSAFSLPDGKKEYVVSQRIRFDPSWQNVKGGKMGFGIGGGTATTGGRIDPKGFSSRYMFRPGNKLVLYTYQTNRRYTNGRPWGDDNLIFTFIPGEWFLTRMVLTLNSKGKKDGSAKVYIDGTLRLSLEGVEWQGEGTPGEKMRGSYHAFFGGSGPSWSPSSPQTYQLKDILYYWK